MNDAAWQRDFVRCLGMLLAGDAMDEVDERGQPLRGDTLLVLLNAHHEEIPFRLPSASAGRFWERLADTFEPGAPRRAVRSGSSYALRGRSVALFRLRTRGEVL
jgi:glycogen operon protein